MEGPRFRNFRPANLGHPELQETTNQNAPELGADGAGLRLPVCTPRGYPAPADKLVQRSFSGRS